jgi:hypothetical protein
VEETWEERRADSHTNCKVNRLALTTSHITPYNTPHPSCSFHFLRTCKRAETFWRSLVHTHRQTAFQKPLICI